ncbi:MAG: class I SAM-dependent methyltransferase [Planctomycetota bacterium]
MSEPHSSGAPSPWVVRWLGAIPAGGPVLDLACGGGRHVQLLREHGHPVTAVDRDTVAVRAAFATDAGVEVLTSDLEGAPWPLAGRTFAGVVVTNYLWRPLLPAIVAAVAPCGVLLYETFLLGHELLGRPRNPDFLLRPGELRAAVAGALEVIEFQEGPDGDPPVALRQRLCARRPARAGAGAGS